MLRLVLVVLGGIPSEEMLVYHTDEVDLETVLKNQDMHGISKMMEWKVVEKLDVMRFQR